MNVSDDDGGTARESSKTVVKGDVTDTRGSGFWRYQFDGRGQSYFDRASLEGFLSIANFGSTVFSENVTASSFNEASDILSPARQTRGKPPGNARLRSITESQLLAAWLNFASGSIDWNEEIDTDGDGRGDTPFHEVIYEVEQIVNDSDTTKTELTRAKDLTEAINEGA